MNLKNLSDESLHQGNLQDAKVERERLIQTLHRLRETERRRLYSKYKCSSLFDYCIKHLQYSAYQADSRIKAMRLLKDVPEVEEKIGAGALNLTNLALAQKLFVHEQKAGNPVPQEKKIAVLQKLEYQPTRAAEKIVFEIQPEMKPKANALDFNSIEDDTLREKLLQVKGLFAHIDPDMSLSDLLHKLCDQEIAKKTQITRAPKVNSQAEIKRQVWRRDHGKCVNCASTHAVQVEHRIPKAMGGPWTLENLCLLCRSCNQRSAIEYYGMSKMQKYLKSPSANYKSD